MADALREKAGKIRWIILDVDGVMTDGGITYDGHGVESKTFHVRDGHGIKLAQRAGVRFAIITGRTSHVVTLRAEELGIAEVHQGAKRKLAPYEELIRRHGIKDEEIACVGDDVVDLPVLKRVGLSASVADGDAFTRGQVDLVLSKGGGQGAVREFIEIILKAQGKWEDVTERYH